MTGPAFQQGDDYVAARVSIDVPTEGLQSIKELSTGLERFRTIVEASARSTGSYVGFLQQMTQAANLVTDAHLKMAQQLERTADLQQRAMTGGQGMPNAASALPLSRAAPQAYADPFAGMGAGMGGTRPGSPSDVPSQMQAQSFANASYGGNPQQYVNAQAGRSRTMPNVPLTPTGAPDWGEQANRVQQRDQLQQRQSMQTPSGGGLGSILGGHGGGLSGNLVHEMLVGGGALNVAHRVADAIGSRGAKTTGEVAEEGAGGGGLTSMMKSLPAMGVLSKLGPVGLAIGGGLAGLGLVERGGGEYQQLKNTGLIRGGGAGEGVQTEMGIRALALNPFLTNDQARQIVMAGLTEGYSGKQFDSATQFMASNLKDMNLTVSDSVQLLRKNVVEGGQSVAGLATSLGVLKEMSKTGAMSLPDLAAQYKQGTGEMISRGTSGGMAGEAANDALGVWSGDKLLAGKFLDFSAGVGDTALSGAMMQQYSGVHIPGVDPRMAMAVAQDMGMNPAQLGGQALEGAVRKLFGPLRYRPGGDNRAWYSRIERFMQVYQMISPNATPLDPTTAIAMVKQVQSGNGPTSPTSGINKARQIEAEVNPAMGEAGKTGGDLGAIGNSLEDFGKMTAGAFTGNDTAFNNARQDVFNQFSTAAYNDTAEAQNPVISKLVSSFGAGNVQVVGPNGEISTLTGSKAQVQGLASGQMKWRRKGSEDSYTLAQTPQDKDTLIRMAGNNGQGGSSNTNVNFSPATVNIKFDNSGPTASPNPVQLTPNQQQTNSGYGNATANNPPPGDGYGYYRGRMPGFG